MCLTLSRKMRRERDVPPVLAAARSRARRARCRTACTSSRGTRRGRQVRRAGSRPGSRACAAGARAAPRASRRSRSPSSPSSAGRSRRSRAAPRSTRRTVYLNLAWRLRKSSVRISLPPPVTQWTPGVAQPRGRLGVREVGTVGEVHELRDRQRVELDPVAVALAHGGEQVAVVVERQLRVEAAVERDEVAADLEQLVDLREHLVASRARSRRPGSGRT